MPTYEYECRTCGLRLEKRQSAEEAALTQCPQCGGKLRRLMSGGAGFVIKGSGHEACSLKQGGKTCCGREERCGKPPCGDHR